MNHSFIILSTVLLLGQAPARSATIHTGDLAQDTATLNNVQQYTIRYQKGGSPLFGARKWKTSAQEVWLTGQLLVIDDDMRDVELLIAVENGTCDHARITRNGRFDIILPAGAKARLTFQKPGHIAKEINVDAKDLKKDLIGRGEDRKVNFDVILAPEEAFPGLAHDGPVGTITFRRGTGALMVDHHPSLVAADRVCKLNK